MTRLMLAVSVVLLALRLEAGGGLGVVEVLDAGGGADDDDVCVARRYTRAGEQRAVRALGRASHQRVEIGLQPHG